MGVELHITRAEHWADSDGPQITGEEWLRYVATDPDLHIASENGQYFVLWSGASKYQEPWLDWHRGSVFTKWPDTALYEKMLQVARALGAKVQDDDGTIYTKSGDWVFDPTQNARASAAPAKSSWWQRLLQRK